MEIDEGCLIVFAPPFIVVWEIPYSEGKLDSRGFLTHLDACLFVIENRKSVKKPRMFKYFGLKSYTSSGQHPITWASTYNLIWEHTDDDREIIGVVHPESTPF